jgi:FHA domain-containing protein
MPTGPDDRSPRFELELTTPERGVRRFSVGPDGLLIGRLPDCDVSLPTRPVAERHAYVYGDAGKCFVKCLSPAAVMTIAGDAVPEDGMQLREGDVISVGGVQLVFRIARRIEPGEAIVAEQPGALPGLVGSGLPLAVAAMLFSVLACRYWAFGIGAAVLGWVSLHELHGQKRATARALACCAIVMGLLCAALNGLHAGCTARPAPTDAPASLPEDP